MKKKEEDIVKLQISKKSLEDDQENVLMKNNILLRMNKDLKDENKRVLGELNDSKDLKDSIYKDLLLAQERLAKFDSEAMANDRNRLKELEIEVSEKDILLKSIEQEQEFKNKEFNDLEDQYSAIIQDNDRLQAENAILQEDVNSKKSKCSKLNFEIEQTRTDLKLEINKTKLLESEKADMLDR